MYNLSVGELPDVLLHMFRRNSVVHNYPTRQRDAFPLPRTRTIFAKKNNNVYRTQILEWATLGNYQLFNRIFFQTKI